MVCNALLKFLALLVTVVAVIHGLPSTQRAKKQKSDDDFSQNVHVSTEGRRKTIAHRQSFAKSHHWGISHQTKGDLCRFKRCFPGQKCVVEGTRAKCVCRVHCKPMKKPVCGIDGNYYPNRCEMHKAACLSSRDIYDARNRDCFYKQSECGADDFREMQASLLANVAENQPVGSVRRQKRSRQSKPQHHHKKNSPAMKDFASTPHPIDEAFMPNLQATLDVERIDKIDHFADQDPLASLASVPAIFDEVVPVVDDAIPDDDTFKRVRSEVTFETTEKTASNSLNQEGVSIQSSRALWDDIITSDGRGDDVKRLFRSLDLDLDGFIGSEEIHEVTLMEGIEEGSTCTLYHLLHYADGNEDKSIDIMELLSIFNVTVLHLDEDKRVLDVCSNHGERLTIQCDIQGENSPVWRRYNYDLRLYGDDGITVDGSLVYFASVSSWAAGNYTCSARNRPDIFQVIRMSVFSPPNIQVFPRTQHRLVGDSVTVACHVTGMPPPHITWLINGEGMIESNDRYKVLGNHTEMHINSAVVSDSAAYSCFASNDAGNSEEIAAVFIEEENDRTPVIGAHSSGAYFIFHDGGFLIVAPRSCDVTRRVSAAEEVPGLLRQNKLCRASFTDGTRRCRWSSAVSVGARFVYAAQPLENRIVVVDAVLQRVAEVIATDPLPVTMHYVASTEQLFVLCWVDEMRDRSALQVIHAANVPGTHSATQIQPLDGGSRSDFSVFAFFVPPEGDFNTVSRHGYVAHKNQQSIHKLDLSTLVYDTDVIDLQIYGCVPDGFSYQPIGGQLHVTCAWGENEDPRSLTVDPSTNMVVEIDHELGDFSQEFVSKHARHVVRVFPHQQELIVFNVTAAGEMVQDVVLHTNFHVADVAFEESSRNGNAATVYVSSKHQADIMYLNAATGSVEIIDNLSEPDTQQTQAYLNNIRALVPSSWYNRHIAVAGRNGVDIITVDGNEVVCRLNEVVGTSTIAWNAGEN